MLEDSSLYTHSTLSTATPGEASTSRSQASRSARSLGSRVPARTGRGTKAMPHLHIDEDARFALSRVDAPGACVWDKVSAAEQVGPSTHVLFAVGACDIMVQAG